MGISSAMTNLGVMGINIPISDIDEQRNFHCHVLLCELSVPEATQL
jgi:extradiol dioxygenase family protein